MSTRPPPGAPSQATPEADLTLLGGFALRQGAELLPTPPAAQRVLAYLAVQHDPVPRAKAAHTLWPDAEDGRAAARLRSALWRVPDGPCGPLVDHPAGALGLTPRLHVDAHQLEEQATLLGHEEHPEGRFPEPRALCRELLPDWEDEWLVAAREWLRQVRLRALERLCVHHCRAGRTDDALDAGMAAISCEPLRESAHRMVAATHLADGNSAEALRQYDMYRRLLRDELGVAPSEKFRRLLAPLLARPLDTPT